MWPFSKKTEVKDLAKTSASELEIQEEEPKIKYQKRIENLRIMKLFSKFSLSVGQRIFVTLPGTSSALCTMVEEAFMGVHGCYFTVSDSLQNLRSGGTLSDYGCKNKSKIKGNRIYFDITGFFHVCCYTNDRMQLHVETIVETM